MENVTTASTQSMLDDLRKELSVLSAITDAVAASLDSQYVMETTLEQVLAITAADTATIYVLDPEQRGRLQTAANRAREGVGGAPAPWLEVERSISGEAVRRSAPAWAADYDATPGRSPQRHSAGMRSVLAVPIVAQGLTLGALAVASVAPGAFTDRDCALLVNVGRQVGVALENTRLHERERHLRQLADTLSEVSRIVNSSLDLDSTLNAILMELKRLVAYDSASVMLIDAAGRLTVSATTGFDLDTDWALTREALQGNPILEKVCASRQPVLVRDTQAEPLWIVTPAGAHVRTFIGAPLVVRNRVIGVLNVDSKTPAAYDTETVATVQAFAEHAAIAIENARLFGAEAMRRRRAELLHRTSTRLAETTELEALLDSALSQLRDVLDYDAGCVALIDGDAVTFAALAGGFANQKPPTPRVPIAALPDLQHLVATARPALVPDATRTPLYPAGVADGCALRCWIGAPLVTLDGVVGVLSIHRAAAHSFDDDDVHIVQTLANYLAALVRNRRLVERATKHSRDLQTLNTIAAEISQSLDPGELLSIVLDRVLAVTGAKAGAIHLTDPTGAQLVLQVQHGLSPETVRAIFRAPAGAGFCDQVLTAEGPVRYTVADPSTGPQAFLAVPLAAAGRVVGALSVATPAGLTVDGEQTALVVSIGRHAGAAVVNAQHYQEALSRERMSRVLSGLGMAISATLDEQEVLDLICRESTAIFGVESALVSLVEGDELVVAAAYGQGMAAYLGSRERIFIGRSLGARVVVARKPQYENRVPQLVRAEAPAWLAETGTQAKLGVPMIRDGKAVGAIVLVSTHNPDRFCEEDLELANLLAIQAALALQNARLYAEVNRRLEFGRLVGEVGRASTAILSEAAMMQGVCQRIYEAFGYDIIALFQCAPTEDAGEAARRAALTTQAVYINGAAVDASALDADVVPLHVAERAARRAESVLISAGLRVTDTPERAGRTDLAVPFVMGEDVLGVLAITRLEPNAIDESEVDLLQTLAAQLAISLSNARLFDTVRRQRDELEDRVRARTAEIAAQKEQTEAILRSVPDAVIVADLGGEIVMTNPPAAYLLEKPETEHNVREWVAALVTDDDDALREMELSGQVYQATASRVVQGGTELGTVVVVRDITRLYELDRLKSQFVSTVSHELRTPLTNIKLYLSLLQQGKPERQQSYIQVIDRESRHLERLVADLLDLSRLERQAEPPQREMLDIACVINAVLDNHAIQAELKRQTLAFVPDGLLPTVNADRNQLIQVFTNLVGNAVQYTPEGGRVTVRACATGRDDAPSVCVAVSDTGPGIPPEEIDRIFDRFYRGSNVAADAAPGTGLGLAIVREIINLHCGTIEVSSQVGEGSTFTVVLPAALPK